MSLPVERALVAVGIGSHRRPRLVFKIDIRRQRRANLLRALGGVGDCLREPCKLLRTFNQKRTFLCALAVRHADRVDAHAGVNVRVLQRQRAGNHPQQQNQRQQQR